MERLVSLLQDRRISAEDFFVFRLLFDIFSASNHGLEGYELSMDGKEKAESEERFKAYYRDGLNMKPFRETLLVLMEHGLVQKKELRKNLDWEDFNPMSVLPNRNFLDKLWRYSFELGKELREAYPNIGYIDGKEIPLKTIRKMNCEEELFTRYAKSIGHDPKEHQKVLDLVAWSVENRTAFTNMSLESFVIGRIWESVEEFRNNGETGYMMGSDDYFTYV